MRGFNKFLFKNKWHSFCFFFKKRLLRLKRPKWKLIQNKVKKSSIDYYKFLSHIPILNSLKFFRYLQLLKTFYCYRIKNKFFNITFIKKGFLFIKKLNSFLKNFYFYKLKKNIFYYLKHKYMNKNSKYFFKKSLKNFFFSFKNITTSHFLLRSRFFFKNLLFMKSTVLKYFNGCFSVNFFKKIFLTSFYRENLISIFIKPEFRLDILLWRLKFFNSPYLARFAFQNNLIFINNNLIFFFYSLKQHFKRCLNGVQLISLKSDLIYSFKNNLNHFEKSIYISTFLEIDYYLGNIIILKDLKNLNYKDINSILKEPINFYKFKDFIKK